ncbi:MAG: hypothetical protein LBO04_04275 [Spirochaetaceae bacterium]|jgi:chromosome segregation ATPase|nr:hypothetical protein [Spirochaetaceae bacterium]
MSFFDGGNLLTIGIVFAFFILSRFLDKGSRGVNLARAQAKKLKDEIEKEFTEFTDDKAAALRGYGVILEGDFKRAEALKQNIEAEIKSLDKNLTTVNELNTRIKKYEAALRELDSWTEKVEENLRHIGSESAYVERVAETIEVSNDKLNEVAKKLDVIQDRIKTEIEQSVRESSGAILLSVQSAVGGLKDTVEEIGRGVAEHREALEQAEAARRQNVERDMAAVNGALQKVLAAAAEHSSELEAGLLNELNQNAEKRSAELRLFLAEKVEAAGRAVDDRVELIEKSVQSAVSAWEEESGRISEEHQRYKAEWRRSVSELDALALDQRNLWEKLINDNDRAIEEYRRAQEAQVEALASMSDDAGKLDAELREHIDNVKNEIKDDFEAFAADLAKNRGAVLESFNSSLETIQGKVDGLEKDIGVLKNEAYERVSGGLREFEESVEANLTKREENINSRINEWRGSMDRRFDELHESVEAECRRIEHECGETLQQKKNQLNAGFDEEIKRIKEAFDDLGRSISTQTERYERSIKSLETQMQSSIEDARKAVDGTLKTEISRFELQNSEKLKKHERETEEAMREAAANIEERLTEIASAAARSYGDVEAYKAVCAERFNELDAAIENMRRRARELGSENEERLASVRAKIEETGSEVMSQRTEMINGAAEKIRALENEINEADRRINDFFSKTELIDKTIAIKKDVENKIEDLNADMDKLNLHSIEISELKSQFEKIKRMEEELINKTAQFDIEQRRVERMEINFNRLLQTSQSVEERLKHITNADDMLQEAQIKLRKLDDSMAAAEERYQRIEKKNQILEATNDGIEKNLKSLQDSEAVTQKLSGDIQRMTITLEDIRASIETLADENVKARDTMEKLSTLDQTIGEIDGRMQNLQKARVWLAELETRLDEKYREVKQQLKLTEKIINKNPADNESSSPEIRDDVIRLKKQGWTIDEIVKTLRVSRAAVELILETATR